MHGITHREMRSVKSHFGEDTQTTPRRTGCEAELPITALIGSTVVPTITVDH
jgi:hypothetical protein